MEDHGTPVPGKDDDLLEGIVGEAPPVDEYQLTSRSPEPDVSGTP